MEFKSSNKDSGYKQTAIILNPHIKFDENTADPFNAKNEIGRTFYNKTNQQTINPKPMLDNQLESDYNYPLSIKNQKGPGSQLNMYNNKYFTK